MKKIYTKNVSKVIISIFIGIITIAFGGPGIAFASTAATVTSPFKYNFYTNESVEEVGSDTESSSPYWYVNSGGRMVASAGRGKTIYGDLPVGDKWRTLYSTANPEDTDLGLHPQNIFRLVGRSNWTDFTQEAYFNINKYYSNSGSSNRNQSNGVLLFNRYNDAFNLYYTGFRVDGTVVIKKKKAGIYYTMAQKQIFPGTYNISSNPNLLPLNTWLGLRSVVKTDSTGKTHIDVYMDKSWTGNWTLVLSAVDDNVSYGGASIPGNAHGGIRTDFMNVEFDQYKITNA